MLKRAKLIAVLLVMMMLWSIGAAAESSSASASGTCGDNLTWELSKNGVLTISGTGKMYDYDWGEAPWNNANLTAVQVKSGVTSIGAFAFLECSKLVSVTIPDTVTEIGDLAFFCCTGLTAVTIPNSVVRLGNQAFNSCGLTSIVIPAGVTSLGYDVFGSCENLTSIDVNSNNPMYSSEGGVLFNKNKTCLNAYPNGKPGASYTIPDSVTSIGDYAFAYCSNLTAITIPATVTQIGDMAFTDCNGLTAITIPDSVARIGNCAFYGCNGLTSVVIPAGVTWLGYDVFVSCKNLTSINVNSNNPNYSSEDGVLFNKDKTTLDTYPWGKTGTVYAVPASVTVIGDYAFIGCSSLTAITIPAGIACIDYCAFGGCDNLSDVWYSGSSDQWNRIDFVELNHCLTEANIHFNTTRSGTCGSDLIYALDRNGVLTISGTGSTDNYEYEEPAPWHNDHASIKKVIIENGVTRIGEYAFPDEYTVLAEVRMADSVTEIGNSAFRNCDALTNVRLSGGLILIDNVAFEGCSSLSSITLPGNLESIGFAAFASCNLSTIKITNGTGKTWDFFYGRTERDDYHDYLYHIILPASVKEVEEGAFCENPLPHDTPDFVLPSKLTAIESETFYGIKARFVWISSGVESIGSSAFAACPSLEYVYIPVSCETIGQNAFPAGTKILVINPYSAEKCPTEIYAEKNGLVVVEFEYPYGGNG